MEQTSFRELAETLEKVRLAKGKNEKVSILASLFSRLKSEDEVEYAARFAAGRSTRKGSADETQVGYSALMGVLREVTGVTQEELSKSYLKHGDLSESFADFIGRGGRRRSSKGPRGAEHPRRRVHLREDHRRPGEGLHRAEEGPLSRSCSGARARWRRSTS